MYEGEEHFLGGIIGATRVQDTVRKPAGPWTPAVQHLLRHLYEAGFTYAPRPLGTDAQGREVLSYIDGTPANRPWPPQLVRLDGVITLTRMTKQFHEAVDAFRPSDPIWRIGPRGVKTGEIVCHGDLGPWNTLWRGERLVGLVDWDTAEPGPPILDLASLALNVVPLRDDEYAMEAGFTAPPARRERLSILCDTYGRYTPLDVAEYVLSLHQRELQRTLEWGAEGREPWATFLAQDDQASVRRDLHWLEDHLGDVA